MSNYRYVAIDGGSTSAVHDQNTDTEVETYPTYRDAQHGAADMNHKNGYAKVEPTPENSDNCWTRSRF